MSVVNHKNGRIYSYCPAGIISGLILGSVVPRCLANYFNVHITNSMAYKIFFACVFLGVIIGAVLSCIMNKKMTEYRDTHTTKEYVIRIIIETVILLIIIVGGLLFIKYDAEQPSVSLYPN